MELFLVLILVLVVVAIVSSRRANARREAETAERVAAVRRVAEEDVTRLGEEVAGLDVEVAGRELDTGLRQDYQRALDAYEHAKAALDAVRRPEDVAGVTEAVEDGRYAAACVRARVNGEPLPTRRPPCFFNPGHGPSVEDVSWAPPGGAPRPVPVCAADAERVRAGAEPDSRKVLVGAQRRPYWEAGPDYAPWARGYFGGYQTSGLLPGVLMGALLANSFGGWGDPYGGYGYEAGYDQGFDQGYDQGYGSGNDGSGYDGQGYDGQGDPGQGGDGGSGGYSDAGDFGGGDSGGDFGGGDWGGGDWGGGNW